MTFDWFICLFASTDFLEPCNIYYCKPTIICIIFLFGNGRWKTDLQEFISAIKSSYFIPQVYFKTVEIFHDEIL